MSNRFSTQVKKGGAGQNGEKLTVAIIGARPIDGAIGLGAPVNYINNGITYLENHILFIERNYSNIEWYMTIGCDADRIIKKAPNQIHLIENMNYKTTNEAEEVRLLLNASKAEHILFLLSYKLFNDNIKQLTLSGKSSVLISKEVGEVGITYENDLAIHLSYGIYNEWLGQLYLGPKEIAITKDILKNRNYQNICLFELINIIIDKGGKIKVYENIN